MAVAIASAKSLGLNYDINNPMHKWVIAILLENTQFSNSVMQAILQVDFGGRFTVVTISQNTFKVFNSTDVLKQASEEDHAVYEFRSWDQQTLMQLSQ